MEEDSDTSHAVIAQYTTSLGILLCEKGDLIESQSTISKALNIFLSIYGTDHYSVCSTYATLADIAQKRGCVPEAIEYYKEILEIKSRLLGTKHPRVGKDLNVLAMLLASQYNFSEAILNHMGAIKAFEYTYGEEHAETVNARGNMGITMLLKGDIEGLTIIQESICMLVRAGFSTLHPWLKKFLEYARRGEVGSTISDGIDVENATFQPTQFSRQSLKPVGQRNEEATGPSHVTDSVKSAHINRISDKQLLPPNGLGMMPGIGLHRLNATPLSLSDVEMYRKLVMSPPVARPMTLVPGGKDGIKGNGLTSSGTTDSAVVEDVSRHFETDRLPYAALVLTE